MKTNRKIGKKIGAFGYLNTLFRNTIFPKNSNGGKQISKTSSDGELLEGLEILCTDFDDN